MFSYVVTGGGRGVGRAVIERLLDAGHVAVAIELDQGSLEWADEHPASDRIEKVIGDAADETVLHHAVEREQSRGQLSGWVNNAAIFRDATLHTDGAATVLQLVNANLEATLAGCGAAVRAFLSSGTAGAIVNVSSHQAQRPVPGCLPYATAKAAIEGLTRSVAVDYGQHGIRANAVALGTIAVERYVHDVERFGPAEGQSWARDTELLHALERVGRPDEAAAAIVHLLSEQASFISGAVLPVDGGRSALAREPHPPEEQDPGD
ncbi:SDR family oxidoreductase [Actinobacteria bacterium YIM 96077]|uniref:Short-chain dehydrogenase n=1 Tax=Phytoactinopolyspora halophila TaxID=1981511 RepID=A0A329QFX8_9ACTN|nr:SDR family oxidoreductase [Phytoactinopolyspora halophila]AYY14176.1 SDR family oxidoreductase [Actinobacteria bacterium YIM 96077]RAW10232.1 short-chain dehydrogenase [Phytoactinopolyspora halophila]